MWFCIELARKVLTDESTEETKLWSPRTWFTSALPCAADAAAAASCIDICRAAFQKRIKRAVSSGHSNHESQKENNE